MRNDFETNYLQHWGLKKGEKRKNHKYFERVEKNGKYLYFYTQAEYEAWLHRGQKGLEQTKNKVKGKLNSLASKKTNTKTSILSALSRGKTAAYQLANRSQTVLKKSNVQSIIDRGNKTISSILSRTSKQVQSTVSNVQKTSKAVSNKIQSTVSNVQKTSKAATANIQQRAKKIADNVSKTIKKAGKDTSKAIKQYQAKGEKAINDILKKAGNTKMSSTQKASGIGTTIIASLIATAAVVAAKVLAPIVVEKAKELIDKIFHPETTVSVETYTTPNKEPKEKPPEEFCSDAKDSYKENLAEHSDIPQKDSPTTRDDDMAAVNPNFEMGLTEEDIARQNELVEEYYDAIQRGDMEAAEAAYDEYMAIEDKYVGYQNNCMNCTLTYDLRRRGYDVDAPWNPNGTYTDTLYDWYEITDDDIIGTGTGNINTAFSSRDAKQIREALEDMYPEGSYGHCNLTWAGEGNGGHDCVWSIENGKAIIRDCQTNQVVSLESYVSMACDVTFVRTDDKKLKDLAYEATADKTNAWGEEDRDEYEDDAPIYDQREYNDYVEDNGQETFKNKDDLNYDRFWKKAAGKKRK